jgi:lipopolysaccharide export system permease protein
MRVKRLCFKGIGMSILDRYLVTQLLQLVLFWIFLFSLIWLAPEILFDLIQAVSAHQITGPEFLQMLLDNFPVILQQAIPIGTLLGVVFLFRRLSLDMEMVAMLTSGITPMRLLLPVTLVGLLLMGCHVAVQELINPVTAPRLEAVSYSKGLKEKKEQNFLFVEHETEGDSESSENNLKRFFLIGHLEKKQDKIDYSDFIVLDYGTPSPGTESGVPIRRIRHADSGVWNAKTQQWELFNGVDYRLDPDGVFTETATFSKLALQTSPTIETLSRYQLENPNAMSFSRLAEYVALLKLSGQEQDVPFYQVRLYQKYALPLATLVFAILGVFLGPERFRSKWQLSLTSSAGVIFLYAVSIPTCINLASLGLIPVALAAWLPLLVAIVFTVGVYQIRSLVQA